MVGWVWNGKLNWDYENGDYCSLQVHESQVTGDVGNGYKCAIETLNTGRIGIVAQVRVIVERVCVCVCVCVWGGGGGGGRERERCQSSISDSLPQHILEGWIMYISVQFLQYS